MPWARDILPEQYGDKDRSPFIVDIQKGANDIPLALETAARN
jgi:hypothetical protein